MRRLLFFAVVLIYGATTSFADRTSQLQFDSNGNLILPPGDSGVNTILNFPSVSTAYVVGRDGFRGLLEFEIARQQAVHEDFCIGEQFLGGTIGYTLGSTGIGNISLLVGAGYDFDKSRVDPFIGLSHNTPLFGLSVFKMFNGYDIVTSRIRSGVGYELCKFDNWSLDAVGTSKLFGSNNFAGLNFGYDVFKGAGGNSPRSFEANVGTFVGYDLSVSKVGAGVSLDLRF